MGRSGEAGGHQAGLKFWSGKTVTQDIDMRQMARSIGANINFGTGSVVFNKGDAGSCMYIVQSGVIEMAIGDTVIETVGAKTAASYPTDRTTLISIAKQPNTSIVSLRARSQPTFQSRGRPNSAWW